MVLAWDQTDLTMRLDFAGSPVKTPLSTRFLCIVTFWILLSGQGLFGQNSLALSSGNAASNGTVALSLTLTSPSGSEPAGIQWTFNYNSSAVTAFSVSAGAASTNAGK